MNLSDKATEVVNNINNDPASCTQEICVEHGTKIILEALQEVQDAAFEEIAKYHDGQSKYGDADSHVYHIHRAEEIRSKIGKSTIDRSGPEGPIKVKENKTGYLGNINGAGCDPDVR